MAKRVLVTGGCGFIGSHLVRGILEAGDSVRVLDNLLTGRKSNLEEVMADVDLHEGDIRDDDACKRACEGVDEIFHEAALPSVPRSVNQPKVSFACNALGTNNLLLAARDAGVRRVVLASSSSLYGNQPGFPRHEGMPLQPMSPYAAQKAATELLGLSFAASMGVEVAALRYFNVFGPRQDPNSKYAAVVPAFIASLLAGKAPTIHGDGEQSRDFSYVADVVQANFKCMAAEGSSGLAFNVAGGQRVTINELFGMIQQVTGITDIAAEHTEPRAGDVRDSFASIDRAREVFGFEPQVSLEEGIRRTYESLKA